MNAGPPNAWRGASTPAAVVTTTPQGRGGAGRAKGDEYQYRRVPLPPLKVPFHPEPKEPDDAEQEHEERADQVRQADAEGARRAEILLRETRELARIKSQLRLENDARAMRALEAEIAKVEAHIAGIRAEEEAMMMLLLLT